MAQAEILEFPRLSERSVRLRVADVLSRSIFGAMASLLVLTAVPYGTAEFWWKSAFVSAVFIIFVVAIIEWLLRGDQKVGEVSVWLPVLSLSVLGFLQTTRTLSADPYATRFVVLQLLALTACLILLYRYVNTESRLRWLVYFVIGVAVASAIYGILRQTMQHSPGFLLPKIKPQQGYGQFVNKNHFALLQEMAFGLGLGMMLAGAIKRERVLLLVALLLPIWTGLVLSNSRGGILAMLAQVVAVGLLLASLKEPGIGMLNSMSLRLGLVAVLSAVVLLGVFWIGGDALVGSLDSASSEIRVNADGLRQGVTRNEIWRATGKMFQAHPMLGVGLGGYWVAITTYHDASGTMTPQEAHNDYLELLSSGGLVGFALGVWFVVAVVRRALKNLRSSNRFCRAVCFGAVIGLCGVAMHSLVDFGLHMMVNALLFMTLVMMATARIERERS
ncbi:MAG TPA: O-antigen ligase family protein [Pyrinomonadaceae bacterium]|nr:O-antigen ligase family protein [Pyrinomonadaceae bacterium]